MAPAASLAARRRQPAACRRVPDSPERQARGSPARLATDPGPGDCPAIGLGPAARPATAGLRTGDLPAIGPGPAARPATGPGPAGRPATGPEPADCLPPTVGLGTPLPWGLGRRTALPRTLGGCVALPRTLGLGSAWPWALRRAALAGRGVGGGAGRRHSALGLATMLVGTVVARPGSGHALHQGVAGSVRDTDKKGDKTPNQAALSFRCHPASTAAARATEARSGHGHDRAGLCTPGRLSHNS